MVIGDRHVLLDIVKGACITVVIFILYLQVPLVGMGAGVVAPLPLLYYQLKWGRRVVGLSGVFLSAVALLLVGGPAVAVLYLVQAGLLSVSLSHFLMRGVRSSRSLALGVLVVAVVAVATLWVYATAKGVDLHGQVTAAIRTNLAQTIDLYKASGASEEDIGFLKEGLTQAGTLFSQIYPAMLLVSLAVVAGINLLVLSRFRHRLAVRLPDPPFASYRNSDYLVWGLIAAGFALIVENQILEAVALNVVVIAVFLYFIQGIAVVTHFFSVYAVPTFFRTFFYVLLVLQAYLVIAVALLGLFDLWADFRRPRIQKNL